MRDFTVQMSPWATMGAGMTCLAQCGDRLTPRLNGGHVWDGSRGGSNKSLEASQLQRHRRSCWHVNRGGHV
ncbi:hypothetical protein DAI22_01g404300 [Oryza sativa Japonica Group]|nr:hypothetical protein DAI22_01g404300 [Oryza sativa Japonica Group]